MQLRYFPEPRIWPLLTQSLVFPNLAPTLSCPSLCDGRNLTDWKWKLYSWEPSAQFESQLCLLTDAGIWASHLVALKPFLHLFIRV